MGMETGRLGALTISIGTSISDLQRISDIHWLGLQLPTGWDAATLALEFSGLVAPTTADADWWSWRSGAGEVALPAAANAFLTLPTDNMLPFITPGMWMRLRSGTRAAPVNQTANRVVTLFTRRRS